MVVKTCQRDAVGQSFVMLIRLDQDCHRAAFWYVQRLGQTLKRNIVGVKLEGWTIEEGQGKQEEAVRGEAAATAHIERIY